MGRNSTKIKYKANILMTIGKTTSFRIYNDNTGVMDCFCLLGQPSTAKKQQIRLAFERAAMETLEKIFKCCDSYK